MKIVTDKEGNQYIVHDAYLTPYDKFADLKKAYSEGALLEIKIEDVYNNEWKQCGKGSNLILDWDVGSEYQYRIKDNISIESWNAHKDVIKEYWNGAEIETLNLSSNEWYNCTDTALWYPDLQYRVKQEVKELTIGELEAELGYKIKVVGE